MSIPVAESWSDLGFGRREPERGPYVNVGPTERWVCGILGSCLALYGIRHRSTRGLALVATGTSLLYRSMTGHCAMYAALDVDRNGDRDDTAEALSGSGGVNVERSITINKPVTEVYRFWRRLENLPRFMDHLVSVVELDDIRSHWIAKAPAGMTAEWDAEIINEVENQVIGWRSLPGSDVTSAGSVNFDPAPGDRGTEVRVKLQYDPPAGKVGAAVAKLFGQEPSQQIAADLYRLKQLLETGEIAVTAGQPSGRA